MPPKFALQPVLDFRHSKVEALEIELAELLKEAQKFQNILNSLKELIADLLIELSDRQKGDIDLFAIQHLRGNIQLVEGRIEQVKAALVEANQRVELKRLEMVQARQEEETLHILKNKEIERFKEEQNLIENRQMDDVYISQAFRRQQAGEAYL